MPKVTIQVDAQKALLDALIAVRQTFLDAGVTVTKAEVANWPANINAVNSWAKWQAYEKKSSLLLIEALIAVARRL